MNETWTLDAINRICHELRRPITVVHSFGELLADEVSGTLNAEQHAHVQAIMRGALNMERQVRALFDLAEIESCNVQLAPRPCDLNELISELHAEYAGSFECAGIGLDLEFGDEPVHVTADPERIHRALATLLDNALHFVPAQEEVTVRLARTRDGARIEVVDAGPGVPAEDRQRIFEPFFRASERGSAPDDGLGLGLALCRAYIAAHGGHVVAESSPLGGLTVRIELPSLPGVHSTHGAPADREVPSPSPHRSTVASATGRPTENGRISK